MLKPIVTVAAVVGLTAGAAAQTGSAPAVPGRGGLLGGLLGGAVPSVGSIGVGNAAGLLGYCIQNKLLGSAAGLAPSGSSAGTVAQGVRSADTRAGIAPSILQQLTGRPGVAASPGYQAGQAGQVQAPGGQTLSLDGLRGQVKNQVCSLVLNRARSFL